MTNAKHIPYGLFNRAELYLAPLDRGNVSKGRPYGVRIFVRGENRYIPFEDRTVEGLVRAVQTRLNGPLSTSIDVHTIPMPNLEGRDERDEEMPIEDPVLITEFADKVTRQILEDRGVEGTVSMRVGAALT